MQHAACPPGPPARFAPCPSAACTIAVCVRSTARPAGPATTRSSSTCWLPDGSSGAWWPTAASACGSLRPASPRWPARGTTTGPLSTPTPPWPSASRRRSPVTVGWCGANCRCAPGCTHRRRSRSNPCPCSRLRTHSASGRSRRPGPARDGASRGPTSSRCGTPASRRTSRPSSTRSRCAGPTCSRICARRPSAPPTWRSPGSATT